MKFLILATCISVGLALPKAEPHFGYRYAYKPVYRAPAPAPAPARSNFGYSYSGPSSFVSVSYGGAAVPSYKTNSAANNQLASAEAKGIQAMGLYARVFGQNDDSSATLARAETLGLQADGLYAQVFGDKGDTALADAEAKAIQAGGLYAQEFGA